MTINRAVDVRRRRQAEPKGAARLETVDEATDAGARRFSLLSRAGVADRADAGAEVMDRETLRADLAHAMSRLSDVQRAVLVAKVYDNMTFAELAAELELAVSTVKTHYLRAVRAVRDRLEPRWAREE